MGHPWKLENVTLPVDNPWQDESPACPRCRLMSRVYLWHPQTKLRWFCARCRLRFATPRRRP